jgi:putative ABC transport system substrate-binding protein
MRRRNFVSLVGGAAAWPFVARAQQPITMTTIGFLSARSAASGAAMLAAFREGLSKSEFKEGQNLRIEYRWAEAHFDRLGPMADDLARRHVAVIGALSGTPAALAAKAATTTIPIVFGNGGDPIASGLVASLSRPIGNITGATFYTVELAGKRLGLLRELVPTPTAMGFLTNLNNPAEQLERDDAEAAARALRIPLQVLNAANEHDIDVAFATLLDKRINAILVGSDPLFLGLTHKLVELAARYRIPAIYSVREFPEVGGLMSYGSKQNDTYTQAGIYVAKILQGAQPADLPVMQPIRFEFIINLKTARALGLTVSPKLLVRADKVIE